MRRRGQALLVVFGVTLSVLIIVAVSYLLVRMFVDENVIVRELNGYETAFSSYTAQVDTNVMSFTGSIVPVLGSNVSVNCSGENPPFMPVYEDYAHYQLASPDYDKKFAECDVRGAYLTRLAELIGERVGELSSGNFTATLGSVRLRPFNGQINSTVLSDPYFYVYSPSNGTASIIFISNGSKFTVFIPNLTTSYDPGVKVCYSMKEQEVYLGDCERPVADYLRLKDEHQLKFSVDARPIYLYDYLAVRYALWNKTLHGDFDSNALVIAIDLENETVNSYIWHADPITRVIPPSIVGKWVDLSSLSGWFGKTTKTPVYFGKSVPGDYGREQQYIATSTVNTTFDPSSLIDLVGYLTFYPSFETGYGVNEPDLFASSNCSGFVSYTPSCAFDNVKNYHFFSRDEDVANPGSYTSLTYGKLFKEVLDSGTVFHSVVGSYIESEYGDVQGIDKDYVGYFERLALSSLSTSGYTVDARSPLAGGISVGISYLFRPGTPGYDSLLNPEKAFKKAIYGDTILGVGYPVSVEGNTVRSINNGTFDVYTGGVGVSLFFLTLLDSGGGVFSPFGEIYTDPANSIAGIRSLRLGNYTLGQILGSSVRPDDFKGLWASLPAVHDVKFRIHDVRIKYFYTLNLSDEVKVMIRSWTYTAGASWLGIDNGTCICYIGNTTYNCTYYENPKYAFGYRTGKVDAPVTSLDGGFSFKTARPDIVFNTYVQLYPSLKFAVNVNGETDNGGSAVSLDWKLYQINGFPSDYDSQYIFLRRSYPSFSFAGCNVPVGNAYANVYAKKVFVGVRQVYNVSAVLSMKVDFKITGNLYGIDYTTLKRVVERFLNVSDSDYDTAFGSLFRYVINGEDYPMGRVGSDIGVALGGSPGSVLIPPELIFSSNLYVYVPFTVEIKDFPVIILYKFLYGYPGKIDDVEDAYSPNNLNDLSYNWFDITKEIPVRDIATDNVTDIKRVALSLVDNIASGSIPFPFLETPTESGGYYTSITPPGLPADVHVYVRTVGSLENTKVITTGG